MSTHDSASKASSMPSSEVVPARSAENIAKSDAARKRSLVLLGILVLLLGALWYDYKIARPKVEFAYEAVGKVNSEYNAYAGKKYLTEKEVQTILNRQPASFIDHGTYHVEVYSWRSGLPIRSHNYYAVYSAGTPLVFLKHYKYELPMEELRTLEPAAVGEEQSSPEDETAQSASKERKGADDKTNSESASSEPAAGKLNPAEASAEPAPGDQPSNPNETPTPAKEKSPDAADQPTAPAKPETAEPTQPTDKPATTENPSTTSK
jgi:hypothetical protein